MAAGQDEALTFKPDYSRREVMFLAEHEKIVHLDDLILRRSLIAMLGFTTGDLLDELASILAGVLNWSAEEARHEAGRAAEILHTRHGVAREKLQSSAQVGV